MEIVSVKYDPIIASTIQLVAVDDLWPRLPRAWGSAIAFRDESAGRFIVTALHVAQFNPGIMRLPTSLGIEIEKLDKDQWLFFVDAPRDGDGNPYHPILDFALIRISDDVDLVRFCPDVGLTSGFGIRTRVFELCEISMPVCCEYYFFGGSVEHGDVSPGELRPNQIGYVALRTVRVQGITLEHIHGRIARFRLPAGTCQSGVSFAGTSGAPILNSRGCPVAMVISGSEQEEVVDAIVLKGMIGMIRGAAGLGLDRKRLKKISGSEAGLLAPFLRDAE